MASAIWAPHRGAPHTRNRAEPTVLLEHRSVGIAISRFASNRRQTAARHVPLPLPGNSPAHRASPDDAVRSASRPFADSPQVRTTPRISCEARLNDAPRPKGALLQDIRASSAASACSTAPQLTPRPAGGRSNHSGTESKEKKDEPNRGGDHLGLQAVQHPP